MLAPQRQAAILERVRATGAVRVAELVAALGVSDMTVRRDLEVLADRGLVSKVYGGATVRPPGPSDEPGFTAKSPRQRAEKAAIARAAAGLVGPGSAVALSAGTTTAALAAVLVGVPDLTVVTNSVPVAQVLHATDRPDRTVVLTGGVRTPSDALVGPVAVAAILALHPETLFLGVHGMGERTGYTTPNLLEAETDRALVAAAGRVVVLADHTKWGTAGMCEIAPLDRADLVISDQGLPAVARDAFAAAGVALRVVPA